MGRSAGHQRATGGGNQAQAETASRAGRHYDLAASARRYNSGGYDSDACKSDDGNASAGHARADATASTATRMMQPSQRSCLPRARTDHRE
jgi:hypothetical protein